MAEESGGDKKHDPTPWRLEKARQDGDVGKSQDLASAIVLLVAVILLMVMGKQVVDSLFEYSHNILSEPILLIPEHEEADALAQSVQSLFYETVMRFMKPMSVFFILLALTGIFANIFQIGFHWLPNKLGLDIKRIDPIKGFGNIFSTKSLVRFLMGILKIVICSVVAWYAVVYSIGEIMNMPEKETGQIAAFLVWLLLMIALKVAAALVIIALIDLMYQKHQHMQKLKMTDQEMRDEVKNMMGDPQLIQKRRQFHQELVSKQQVQGTEDADVVVTNPTHFSVAIKFDAKTMDAPVVVAKGADLLAFQIRNIAAEKNIPIVRKPLLARTLFSTVDIGKAIDYSISREQMQTLVEVIRYAYSLTGRDLKSEMDYRERNKHRRAA